MKLIDCEFDEGEDIPMDKFNLNTDVDGHAVDADCIVWFGNIAEVHLLSPYSGISFRFKVEDDKENFYDHEEAVDYIIKELRKVMLQIGYVKDYHKEYSVAYDIYSQFRSDRLDEIIANRDATHRERFQMQIRMLKEANQLYEEKLCGLLPIPKDVVDREHYIIFPLLLGQILKAIQ